MSDRTHNTAQFLICYIKEKYNVFCGQILCLNRRLNQTQVCINEKVDVLLQLDKYIHSSVSQDNVELTVHHKLVLYTEGIFKDKNHLRKKESNKMNYFTYFRNSRNPKSLRKP